MTDQHYAAEQTPEPHTPKATPRWRAAESCSELCKIGHQMPPCAAAIAEQTHMRGVNHRMTQRAGAGARISSDINVTPLIDVLLVLLVIFSGGAAVAQQGFDANLPQAVAHHE